MRYAGGRLSSQRVDRLRSDLGLPSTPSVTRRRVSEPVRRRGALVQAGSHHAPPPYTPTDPLVRTLDGAMDLNNCANCRLYPALPSAPPM